MIIIAGVAVLGCSLAALDFFRDGNWAGFIVFSAMALVSLVAYA